MPIGGKSDTQYSSAGYSCLLSGCRTAVVPHLAAQHLGKMYATNLPLGALPPCIFPRSSFPIGILDYIFLRIWFSVQRQAEQLRMEIAAGLFTIQQLMELSLVVYSRVQVQRLWHSVHLNLFQAFPYLLVNASLLLASRGC